MPLWMQYVGVQLQIEKKYHTLFVQRYCVNKTIGNDRRVRTVIHLIQAPYRVKLI